MLIRTAISTDIPAGYALACEFDGPGNAKTAAVNAFAERLGEIIDSDGWAVLLADHGGGLAGYALVQDYGPHPRRRFSTGRLHDLFVRERYRRTGIGTQLMAAVNTWCRARPSPMILDWQSRAEAVGFYESLGLIKDDNGDQGEYPGFCWDFRT